MEFDSMGFYDEKKYLADFITEYEHEIEITYSLPHMDLVKCENYEGVSVEGTIINAIYGSEKEELKEYPCKLILPLKSFRTQFKKLGAHNWKKDEVKHLKFKFKKTKNRVYKFIESEVVLE